MGSGDLPDAWRVFGGGVFRRVCHGVAVLRPTYENVASLVAEQGVSERLKAAWQCEAVKLPKAYRVDFALLRNGAVKAWSEIKNRSHPKAQYPTLMLSLGKVMAGLELANRTGVPFLLVVQWADEAGWLQVKGVTGLKVGAGLIGTTNRT